MAINRSVEIEGSGRFGSALLDATERNGLTIRDIAIKTGGSYEHTRKLIKGLAYPSKYLLRELCKVLKLDFGEMEALVTQDKLEHTYGKSLHVVTGKNPLLIGFEEIVPLLSDDQREGLLAQARALARQNRKKA